MDAHKEAVLRAWWAYPMPPYEGSEFDLKVGRPPHVLGGERVRRQVVKVLLAARREALYELEAAMEHERGHEWWLDNVEHPAEREIRASLRRSVPRRAGETEEEFTARLQRIAEAMRARLGEFDPTISADGDDR